MVGADTSLVVRLKNNFEFLILNEEKTIINLKFNI